MLTIAETKLDASFSISQFTLQGLKKPYRLDVNSNSGGLLTYINENIPYRELKSYSTATNDIQAIVIELNIRKDKWLVI